MAGRLGVLSLGLARQGAIRRMLELSGWRVVRGRTGDAVAVWGRGRTAWRGMLAARLSGRPLITLEEPVLRGFLPAGAEPPLGLAIDDVGVHFDAARPSRIERILAEDPLAGGEAALALWRRLGLSRTNAWAAGPLPDPGFVLVVDQRRGDAAIAGGMAAADSFARMLDAALAENPGRPVLVRPHPRGRGHLDAAVLARVAGRARGRVDFVDPRLSPWALLQRAARVYAVTSQLGFEAILAGHRPRLFGLPFYAGWGLAEEELPPPPRRGRRLDAAQLLAGAALVYPLWYDPFADRLTDFATVAGIIAEQMRQWAANDRPAVCLGLRAWKRGAVARFLTGPGGPPVMAADGAGAVARARALGGRVAVWASREPAGLGAACARAGVELVRLEDGFLRSIGLGARLVAPASLVADPEGIHYDPARPSRLERLIAAAAELPPAALARAEALRAAILAGGVTKYGLDGDIPALPAGRRVVLVLGQVADDAAVRLGATGPVRDNAGLLAAARAAEPGAFVIYRPHPDVAAGLRPGAIRAEGLADAVLPEASLAALLARADAVWTLTSLGGFEALLRGVAVTCLGAPFYAGWGLTRDLGPVPARRRARPTLAGLVHAALIDYPRYVDPVTGRACAPEVIVARLAARDPRMGRAPSRLAGGLARLQGAWPRGRWPWRVEGGG
ncbi:MAG: capsular polysaccharide biosynthesis protein [Paracoccaceae bacterium]|nr:MAG: capsular polysaccharide biosynthesis protein [Paracoccaceae bacterium]